MIKKLINMFLLLTHLNVTLAAAKYFIMDIEFVYENDQSLTIIGIYKNYFLEKKPPHWVRLHFLSFPFLVINLLVKVLTKTLV